jgi:hypothetical protein
MNLQKMCTRGILSLLLLMLVPTLPMAMPTLTKQHMYIAGGVVAVGVVGAVGWRMIKNNKPIEPLNKEIIKPKPVVENKKNVVGKETRGDTVSKHSVHDGVVAKLPVWAQPLYKKNHGTEDEFTKVEKVDEALMCYALLEYAAMNSPHMKEVFGKIDSKIDADVLYANPMNNGIQITIRSFLSEILASMYNQPSVITGELLTKSVIINK